MSRCAIITFEDGKPKSQNQQVDMGLRIIPTSFLRRILGWEYCVIRDLDLFNIPFECPNSIGVGRINDLAIKGWHPHLVLRVEAMGYKCAILFRRRVWFRRRYQRFFDAPSDKDFEINV